MERSAELLRAMEDGPTQECGEGLASIPEAAEEAGRRRPRPHLLHPSGPDRRLDGHRWRHERARLDPEDRGRFPNKGDADPRDDWHYNKGDALYHLMTKSGQVSGYGPVHWDPSSGEVRPYDDVRSPLTSPEIMAELLDQALARIDSDEGGI